MKKKSYEKPYQRKNQEIFHLKLESLSIVALNMRKKDNRLLWEWEKKVIEMMLLKNMKSCLILSSQAAPSLKLNKSLEPCRQAHYNLIQLDE